MCKPVAWLQNPVTNTPTSNPTMWLSFIGSPGGFLLIIHKTTGRTAKTMTTAKRTPVETVDSILKLSPLDWFDKTVSVVRRKLKRPLTTEEDIASLPKSEFKILSSERKKAMVGKQSTDSACATAGRKLAMADCRWRSSGMK